MQRSVDPRRTAQGVPVAGWLSDDFQIELLRLCKRCGTVFIPDRSEGQAGRLVARPAGRAVAQHQRQARRQASTAQGNRVTETLADRRLQRQGLLIRSSSLNLAWRVPLVRADPGSGQWPLHSLSGQNITQQARHERRTLLPSASTWMSWLMRTRCVPAVVDQQCVLAVVVHASAHSGGDVGGRCRLARWDGRCIAWTAGTPAPNSAGGIAGRKRRRAFPPAVHPRAGGSADFADQTDLLARPHDPHQLTLAGGDFEDRRAGHQGVGGGKDSSPSACVHCWTRTWARMRWPFHYCSATGPAPVRPGRTPAISE